MKTLKHSCILMFGAMVVFSLSLPSCTDADSNIESPGGEETTGGGDELQPEEPEVPVDPGDTDDDDLVPNSQNVNYDYAIDIAFGDGTVSVENPYQSNGVTVTVDGHHVVINSTDTSTEYNYILSGITTDGSVKIYGNYKFGLIFNGVGITNPKGAAVNIQCGKKISVTLQDGTNNRLIDGATYDHIDGEDMKGTFFSEGQLVFDGNGTLEVRGKNKHGICSDDYLRVNSGTIHVKEAASDAIHANDYIRIDGGSVTTRSESDGLECEKGYIVINGGELNVVTTGEKGHGIKSKTYTTVAGGNVNVTVYGRASKALNVKEDFTMTAGTLNLATAGDAMWDTDDNDTSSCAGVKCSGNAEITGGDVTIISTGSGGKGINVDGTLLLGGANISVTTSGDQFVYDRNNDTAAKAIKSTGNLTITGGTITVRTSKTEAEGIESKAILKITGGDIDVRAYDDCLNASDHIQIDGGNIYCLSASNDGIDSNGTLTITGGAVVSIGTSSPEAGIDCDNSRFEISGGTILGLGGSTSTPTATACTQRSVIFNTSTSFNTVRISSSSGDVLIFFAPRTFSRTILLFSSPEIAQGGQYTITTGGTISGGTSLNGLYTGANWSGGSSAGTFTASSMVTTVGSSSGGRP